ncbi:MAG: hypothetical protein ABIO70_33590 [Pseudomonadota bacterium]
MLTWLLIALAGCSNTVQIEVEYPTCVDWTPGEEGAIEVAQDGDDWRVTHSSVVQGCDDAFDPDVVGDGKILTVHEHWEAQTEDDCTICFDPTIVLIDPPRGSYELGWYEEGSVDAVDVIAFEVE